MRHAPARAVTWPRNCGAWPEGISGARQCWKKDVRRTSAILPAGRLSAYLIVQLFQPLGKAGSQLLILGGETTQLLQVLITAGQLQPPAFHIEEVTLGTILC